MARKHQCTLHNIEFAKDGRILSKLEEPLTTATQKSDKIKSSYIS